jgi:GR25 family glycosyltransferase involved in LPS biosynthesis
VFDRVSVINLNRRPDRWESFCERLPRPWPWRIPERFAATDGKQLQAAGRMLAAWRSGPGALGCLVSHLVLWREAAENEQRLLVFEDDCLFCADFCFQAQAFLALVPHDWDMIYFGGLHVIPPEQIDRDVLRCNGVKKTHAYAVRGEILRKLPDYLERQQLHIDVSLSLLHAALKVYAPERWLCGQAASVSDVMSGSQGEPERWYQGKESAA